MAEVNELGFRIAGDEKGPPARGRAETLGFKTAGDAESASLLDKAFELLKLSRHSLARGPIESVGLVGGGAERGATALGLLGPRQQPGLGDTASARLTKGTVEALGIGRKESDSALERGVQTVNEFVGGAVLDVPLTLLGGAGLAKIVGTGLTKSFLRQLGKGIVKAPVQTAVAETLASVGAGVGSAAAQELAPDSLVAQAAGVLFGGVAAGIKPTKKVLQSGSGKAVVKDAAPDPSIVTKLETPKGPESILSLVEKIEQKYVSSLTTMKAFERRIFEASGLKLPSLDLEARVSTIYGAFEKAQLDLLKFKERVVDGVKDVPNAFNRFAKWRRVESRLLDDAKRKKFGSVDLKEAKSELAKLKEEIGEETFKRVEGIAEGPMQEEFASALDFLRTSGLIDEKGMKAIIDQNDFYAPFRVIKYIDEISEVKGTGKNVLSSDSIIKAITGIEDESEELLDLFTASAQYIHKARIVGEKNRKMLLLDELADIDEAGEFIKRLDDGAEVRKGFEAIDYFKDGNRVRAEVPSEVAEALRGLNAAESGMFIEALKAGKGALQFGAISANAAFQLANLVADFRRLALTSNARIAGSKDAVQFTLDTISGMLASATRNFSTVRKLRNVQTWKVGEAIERGIKLTEEFVESGAAGGVRARAYRPEIVRVDLGVEKAPLRHRANPGRIVLDTTSKISSFIEETAKLTGFKRLKRLKGIESISKGEASRLIDEVAVEVRRFTGSPDFARQGQVVRDRYLNVLFPFLNARIQGSTADLSRVLFAGNPKKASDRLAAQKALFVGSVLPTVAAYAYNHSSEERSRDFDQLSEDDRIRFTNIPTESFFENFEGKTIREYIQFPKREIAGFVDNLTENALEFLRKRDPESFSRLIRNVLDEAPIRISPDPDRGPGGTALIGSVAESALSGLNPVLRVPMEFLFNRDFHQQRDTVPRFLDDPDVSPELRRTGRESPLAVKAAETLGLVGFGVAPAKLEQAAANITGGLSREFSPPESAAGRPLKELRETRGVGQVLRRFTRSERTAPSEFSKRLREITRIAANKQASKGNKTREVLKKLEDLPGALQQLSVASIADKDEALGKTVARKLTESKLTPDERELGRLPVSDGTKDKAIAEYLSTLSGPEQETALQRLIDSRDVILENDDRVARIKLHLALAGRAQGREE